MCSIPVRVLIFIAIYVLIARTSGTDEAISSTSIYSSSTCKGPYELFLNKNEPIYLQTNCPKNVTGAHCPYDHNMNCTWKIINNSSDPNEIIHISSEPACLQPNDSLLVTNCQIGTNKIALINSADVSIGVELNIGEEEVCVEFLSGNNTSKCNDNAYWVLIFSLTSMPTVITYTLSDTPVVSFNIFNEVSYIRPQNYSFEIWYFNSYNGTSNYTEPRYTIYRSKNLTNYLGSFHQRDHSDMIKSEDNEMTLFVSRNNFLFYHNISNVVQIWFRIPELAAQNCFNSDNFHFIYPTQTTFHINQTASSKGDCNFYVFPALPSNIEYSSATFPTLCMTNIQYNSSQMLEVFSVILLNSVVNNTKLFECNQDSCKDWSNTCVNGSTIKFTIPPDGYLAIDYYSLDDQKKYPVTPEPERHKWMKPVFVSVGGIIALVVIFLIIGSFIYYRFYHGKEGVLSQPAENVRPMQDFSLQLETNNEATTLQIEQLTSNKSVNKLEFPDRNGVYDYDTNDFEEIGIVARTMNIVRKIKHKSTDVEMAVKYITIPKSQVDNIVINTSLKKILQELENFKELSKCPQIVDFYGFCIEENHALICMELMSFSLHDYHVYVHKKEKERVPEEVIGCVSVQIVDALAYCKSRNILHRDIKPKNILIKKSGAIKLCDFGEARIVENSEASTRAGTTQYWPPERFTFEREKYDIRSDVWSLGISLMEVIMGELPYKEEATNIKCMDNVLYLRYPILKTNFHAKIDKFKEQGYSLSLREFLKKCTNKLLNARPKLEKLIEHEFYLNYRHTSPEDVAKFFENINI